MYSIICVYNDLEKLNNQLLASIKELQVDADIILLDNTKHQFCSAAQALNHGAALAKGDVLIFSHQDIRIKRKGEIEQFVEDIEKLPVGTIVGAQGVVEKSKALISNMTYGDVYDASIVSELPELRQVSSVDEGFFGMKRETYQRYRFNEELCNHWHLYSVEMCLHARTMEANVYAHPIQIHHFSIGRITRSYMKGLIRLVDHYHADFSYIWTTCYKIRANRWSVRCLYILWKTKRIVCRKALD